MRYNTKVPKGDLWDYVSNTSCIKKDCMTNYIIKRDGKNWVVDTLCPSQGGGASYTAGNGINISATNEISIDKNFNQFNNYYTKEYIDEHVDLKTEDVKWINVTFNNSTTAEVSDEFITTLTCVDAWVITSGNGASFAYEFTVEAGKLTITASDSENITMKLRLIKEKTN